MYISNTKVFSGMSEVYDRARPCIPTELAEMWERYLGHKPQCVVDVGCGTGQSVNAWVGRADLVYGTEPNAELRAVAEEKYAGRDDVKILDSCGEKLDVPDNSADIITCVQVFHWLDEKEALPEFDRVLKPGGVLAACDFEFPPLSLWKADKAYAELLQLQKEMNKKYPEMSKDVFEADKNLNLQKIKDSGYFVYSRNASFIASEKFNADRFIDLAFSQSTLNRVVKAEIPEAQAPIQKFKDAVREAFGGKTETIQFCMKMTVAVKKSS